MESINHGSSYPHFPFSSMMIRQRPNRPNSTYSTNSYQILYNSSTNHRSDERRSETISLYSHQSSIGIQHDQIGPFPAQQQLNPGLKQVNGRIHIQSAPMSHKTHANKNGTLLDTHVHLGMYNLMNRFRDRERKR